MTSMRRAPGAGFPSALSYHSIQDIDGFWVGLRKTTSWVKMLQQLLTAKLI